jgi:hypothetical protein
VFEGAGIECEVVHVRPSAPAGPPTTARRALLDDARYFDFLARTHPDLGVRVDALAVPSFVARLDTREPLLPGVWKSAVSAAASVDRAHVTPRSLFLGTPFERYDQTYMLDAALDAPALARDAHRLAAGERLHTVVMTNVAPSHPQVTALGRAGFVALPSFPDTVIDLADSWDGHLARLPQGDRSGIRRNIRRFERAGHTLERLADSQKDAAALWEAYKPMFDRARVRWQPHTPAYFEGLAALDTQVRLTVAKNDEGDVIGFVVNFVDPRPDGLAMQAGRVGVRSDYHRRDAVYFRLLYHLVEESIDLGAKLVSMEPTGYRMKRHLGARAVKLVNLVKGVSPSWRMALSVGAAVGRGLLGHLDDLQRLEREY